MSRLSRAFLTGLLLVVSLPSLAASYRYDRERNTIHVERGGVATLSAIHAALPNAPLSRVDRDRRVWLLAADLIVTDGSELRLHGTAAGGDVNELRLRSDNVGGPHAFVSITADHGTLDLRSTHVTSWDTQRNAPDIEHENGRAFIRARSRLRSMVLVPLASRMNIIDSEVAYLGYGANESYGLVWKVVAPQSYVFDHVRVYGDVLRSRIHHNFFGLYTSGAKNSQWRDNEVHHNLHYGMAPHNRSDDLRIEHNNVHHNGHHGITVRQQCARAVIRRNRAWANGESGITVHRDSHGAAIVANEAYANGEAGIIVYASDRAVVRDNLVRDNGITGLQIAMGSANGTFEGNEAARNGVYGIFVGPGKGRPEPPSKGLPRRNRIADNLVYGSGEQDLRMGDPALNRFVDNVLIAWQRPAPVPLAEIAGAQALDPVLPASAQEEPALMRWLSGLTAWQLPDEALWGGAAALLLALVLLSGVGQRRDDDES